MSYPDPVGAGELDEQPSKEDWIQVQKEKIEQLMDEHKRLLVLATKHCPREHHDWQEILKIAGDNNETRVFNSKNNNRP